MVLAFSQVMEVFKGSYPVPTCVSLIGMLGASIPANCNFYTIHSKIQILPTCVELDDTDCEREQIEGASPRDW